jgi:methanogenic corrinoid protein MtbC1
MSQLADALANLNDTEVMTLVRNKMDGGIDPMSILTDLRAGINTVGERYKAGEYFLSELIVSGEIFKESMKLIEPQLETKSGSDSQIKVVLGTVKGDIHSLGKDIVALLLKGFGFEVYDLGIDVPPHIFINKLKETNARILGMSGMLTPSFEMMRQTIEALKIAKLRDSVKVVIGGGIVTELVQRHTGADAWTDDAVEGVEICKKFAEEIK